ncbi:MAG TPA: lysylphosphatidylglycerol synthase domain-containing protein [Gemmatimonadaceae bacterium]|nr:lysylphosphatidylglycerol synthase domain-containing protein [Gemmatimonadaceae bacterium]
MSRKALLRWNPVLGKVSGMSVDEVPEPVLAPTPQPPRAGISRKGQLLLFAAGSAALAFLIIRANPRQLADDIRHAEWAVPAIVAVYGIVYVFNTAAWRLTMVQPPRLSFGRAYVVGVAAFAINYMTPFASIGGEPFKIVAASQWMGASKAAASVLNFRLIHMQAHLLVFLTGVVLAFALLPPGAIATPVLALMAAALIALAALLFAIHRGGALARIFDVLERLPLLRQVVARFANRRAAMVEVDRQMIAFHKASPARYYGALVFEYGARVFAMLEFFIIARAVGHPVTFGTAFLIGGFSSLVVNLFFFMPFNVGSKEGGLYMIFAALGLPARLGVAAAVLSRLRELTWIAIGLLLVLLTRRKD